MKKIICALDPIDSPWPVIAFATHFAKNNVASVSLLFLTLPGADTDYSYSFPNDLSSAENIPGERSIAESNDQLTEDNMRVFKEELEPVVKTFSSGKITAVDDLIERTTGSEMLIANKGANFLSETLPNLTCPVLIAGEDHLPEKVVLLFNQSDGSKIAIEKYIALLHEYLHLPTILLAVNGHEEENEVYFTRLKSSFEEISIKSLEGDEEKKIKSFLSGLSGHILVVLDGVARSGISRLFHESLIDSLLKETNISVFFAAK